VSDYQLRSLFYCTVHVVNRSLLKLGTFASSVARARAGVLFLKSLIHSSITVATHRDAIAIVMAVATHGARDDDEDADDIDVDSLPMDDVPVRIV